MTTLYLTTSDQHLITAQKVKIASGDINSVQLSVTFDSLWDNYPARTAVFYTSNDDTKIEVLLIDDACIIPPEVLTEPCILYVGIRGVSSDGAKVKTTAIVQHKIVPGVGAGATTIEPTMNLYQQYIAAMDARVDPIFNEIKSRLAEQQAAHMAEITDLLTPVPLWTNESPDENFEAQTIEMDLSEFKRISILFLSSSSYGYFESFYTERNIMYVENEKKGTSGTSNDVQHRKLTITDTGISFEDVTNTLNEKKNKYIIPIKITGYKY